MGKIALRNILNIKYIIIFLVIFTTPWFWKILQADIFWGIFVIILTFVLYKLVLDQRLDVTLILIIICFFFLTSIISLQKGFDQDLNMVNVAEKVQLNERHKIYAYELGPIFLNRYVLNFYKNYNPVFYKFERNFFSNLDPNLYFFASHPREREGIDEFNKFYSIYGIFFILGIIYSLRLRSIILLLYLLVTALVSGLISPFFPLGPLLFFPLVAVLIGIGVNYLLVFVRKMIGK